MTYPSGFWTFVDREGRPYGSLAVDHETPTQAWADFYDGMPVERRRAEADGCTCRPALPDDLDRLRKGI